MKQESEQLVINVDPQKKKQRRRAKFADIEAMEQNEEAKKMRNIQERQIFEARKVALKKSN